MIQSIDSHNLYVFLRHAYHHEKAISEESNNGAANHRSHRGTGR